MKSKLTDVFLFFVKKITGYEPVINETQLNNFVQLLDKKYSVALLGDWFVWNYVAFQFMYWFEKKTRMEGKIPQNWIFGPKALKRWEDRPIEWSYFVGKFLDKVSIKAPVDFYKADLDEDFEIERQKYLNTDIGFLHCQFFSRYSCSSISCLICKYKKKCRS